MLCEDCLKFFNQKWTQEFTKKGNYRETGRFHSKPAAPHVCEFCTFLAACPTQRYLRNPFQKDSFSSDGRQYEVYLWSILSGAEHTLKITDLDESGNETIVELNLSRESDISKHGVIRQDVPTSNTRHENCLSRVRTWMDDCTADHGLCTRIRRKRDTDWHPTRLVDVSLETLGPSIRLEDDPEKLAGMEYSTLSYCWGPNPQFLKLQGSNYNSFKQEILLSDLPKTLQEGVLLTRALNLRFIWIDALCIIQDSIGNQDWLQESLKMSQVYGCSYINIAATSSTTAEGGLFRERDPIAVSGISVKPYGSEKEGYVITQSSHWLGNFQYEPLNLRAWAFQERRLSSRTVHFTDSQIYWECTKLSASETYPRGKPWDDIWSGRHEQIAMGRDANHATSHERYKAWWWLVWEYSKGELSVETDRLVAIAGLARSYSTDPDDDYIAGHWRMDMPHGLTWSAVECRNNSIEAYLAPTWSWASIPAGTTVFRPRQRCHPRVEVIELKGEKTGDQFGPLIGGFVRLRGRMCMATLSLNLRKDNYISGFKYNLKFTSKESGTRSFQVNLDEIGEREGQTVFCMELETGGAFFEPEHRMRIGRKWMGIVPRFRGLLLIPTDRIKGEFRRIGAYDEKDVHFDSTPRTRAFKSTLNHWQDYARMNAAFRRCDIPSQYFEELGDMDQYTVRIV